MSYSFKVVDDLETLRAIAHPLRIKLLGALRERGPATASGLGRQFGESSGSTSYHLRQLERFAFIEEDPEQPSKRERRWRASHDMTTFPDQLWESPDGRELFGVVRGRQLENLRAGLSALTKPRRGFGHSDYFVHLDPEELESLNQEIDAVVARYLKRGGSESAAIHVLTLPRGGS